MINLPKVPKPESPQFADITIGQIQDSLKANLSWLDYSFGQSQKLVTKRDKRDYYYPAIHIRSGRYQNVFPDQDLGNYSFFILNDPQTVNYNIRTANTVKINYSLVFWINLDNIFANKVDRNKESIKAEIMKVLTRQTFLSNGRITIESIYEEADNLYQGYSLNEIDSQFLMQPYCGFRFEGEMTLVEPC